MNTAGSSAEKPQIFCRLLFGCISVTESITVVARGAEFFGFYKIKLMQMIYFGHIFKYDMQNKVNFMKCHSLELRFGLIFNWNAVL